MNDDRPEPGEGVVLGSMPPEGGSPRRISVITPPEDDPDFDPRERNVSPPGPAADRYLGCTIDNRYKVEGIVGEGGMGVVYQCRHKIIDKRVALKILRADLASDAEVTERFLMEAKAASAIPDEHIISISDFGQLPDGSTYFVMEYLDGIALTGVVDGFRPAPEARTLNIARQLGEALAAAHAAGIVHRDLKPDNIFLIERGTEKDFVKILDFGIAKVSNTEGKLTRAGAVFGTPHYMSPEQAAGTPVDHRGDVYSLGVILYELATGRVPFDADNFMGVLTQHMYKAPPALREIAPGTQDITPGLEAVIVKCLAKRPEHRYQSMKEFVADIDRLRAGAAPVAIRARAEDFTAPGNYYDNGAPSSRSGQKRTALIFVLLAALAVAAFLLVRRGPGRPPEEPIASREPAKTALPAAPGPKSQPAPSVPATRQVLIAAEPGEAHIFRGVEDLGTGPLGIDVPTGQSVELTLKAAGYKDARVVIDGKQPRQVIQLERVAGRPKPQKPVAPAAKPATKRPSLGGEIIDPWSK